MEKTHLKLTLLIFFATVGNWSLGQIPIADSLLQMAEKGKQNAETTRRFTEAGVHYAKSGYFNESLNCFLKAADISKQLNDSSLLYVCYLNLGNLFAKLQDPARAIEYYDWALEYTDPIDSLKIAQTYLNRGNLTRDSLDYLNALTIYLAVKDSFRISKCYNNLGQLYEVNFDNREKAIFYYHLGEKYHAPILYFNLATAYFKLENFEKAKHYYELSIETEAENTSRKCDAQIGLSKCYAKLGQYSIAFKTLDEALQLKHQLDSISNADILYRKLLELEEKEFEIKKNKYESELKLQGEVNRNHELTIQNRNNLVAILVIGLVIVLAIIALVLYYYRRSQRLSADLKIAVKQLEIESQNIELQALQTTMNPHFVSNSLSSLQYFIAKNDEKESINFVSDFGNLMHEMFEVSLVRFISISREVELLRSYLELEKRRIGKEIDITFDVSSEIDTKKELIPPMLLQPFLENSIWYGFSSGSNKKDRIKINFSLQQNSMLQVTITDNGFGLGEEGNNMKWGSTEIAAKRIKNLWNDQSDDHLNIKNVTNRNGEISGVCVIIQIPVHE